ncbi:MAG TPA: ABC transporter permease, partial [Elainellaceae cyanobacterium]
MPPKVVHTPDSFLKHPVSLARAMWLDLMASRELAWRLMVRDISAQYRQAMLGVLWAFVPPIVMAAGFTLASNANVISVGDTNIPYPAYVMFGTSLWQTFVEAASGPVQAVIKA